MRQKNPTLMAALAGGYEIQGEGVGVDHDAGIFRQLSVSFIKLEIVQYLSYSTLYDLNNR